ncbi:MAG: cysteine--tRNA ligase, partial [Oscillospiraceae bacterium]|nr:cysteine--tRNA ligase [Oscillospiraceae bacterium]
ENICSYRDKFIKVMDDDFNTADGISVIFEFIRDMNNYVSGTVQTSKDHLILIKNLFDELTQILGIVPKKDDENKIPIEVIELFEKRKKARKEKDFVLADSLRDQIALYGYLVEETRQGSRLVPIKNLKN